MPLRTAPFGSWILILAIALAVRLAAGLWWDARLPAGQPFYFGDSDSYWQLGRAIAEGDPYQYRSSSERVFRTPGYPLLLTPLFVVLGDKPDVRYARALGAVFGTAAVAVVGWWTTRLFDARAGHVAGWIAALYPGAVAMSAFVLAEAPFCVFMLLELAMWSAAWRAQSVGRCATLATAGGLAAGAATLIRPSWLLFTPLAALLGLAVDKRRGRQLVMAAGLAVGLTACMLPWWIRNARLTGHFVPTTLQVGASLYDGLNPRADGSSNMAFVAEFTAAEHAHDAGAVEIFEYRLDRRLAATALAWARENPGRAVELAGIKAARMWNVWPNEPSLRAWPLRLVVLLSFAPVAVLSLIGIWRFTLAGWPYVLTWLPAVYLTLIHMVFVGSIRYREPAVLALVALAAGVVARSVPPARD